MRLFALLTSAFVLGIAALATVLPSADAYVPGVNDGPPQPSTETYVRTLKPLPQQPG